MPNVLFCPGICTLEHALEVVTRKLGFFANHWATHGKGHSGTAAPVGTNLDDHAWGDDQEDSPTLAQTMDCFVRTSSCPCAMPMGSFCAGDCRERRSVGVVASSSFEGEGKHSIDALHVPRTIMHFRTVSIDRRSTLRHLCPTRGLPASEHKAIVPTGLKAKCLDKCLAFPPGQGLCCYFSLRCPSAKGGNSRRVFHVNALNPTLCLTLTPHTVP